MKYIVAFLFFLLMITDDQCSRSHRGVYWKLDGVQHTFVWGSQP